ncbi:FUSC-like inner membrane protein YccS domain protein [Bordetella pertussis STO1-CHOC-0021]|nr:FUSC-like inner membrane protein YccS domain protein [Bordetella pertussis STO1-CHOC-0021]
MNWGVGDFQFLKSGSDEPCIQPIESSHLDDAYRTLIQRQSAMTEKHQAARDMVLRALPRGGGFREDDRVMLWNMFVDMLQLLDTLVQFTQGARPDEHP